MKMEELERQLGQIEFSLQDANARVKILTEMKQKAVNEILKLKQMKGGTEENGNNKRAEGAREENENRPTDVGGGLHKERE